jgi:hypothetical protein
VKTSSSSSPSRRWRLWISWGVAALTLAYGISRRDQIAKIYGDSESAAPATPRQAEPPSLAKPAEETPLSSVVSKSESETVVGDSDPQDSQKVLSADEEVQSWGEPVIEGEVRLEDSRLAHQAVYRTQLKYPLIMVQQIWQISASDPKVKDYVGERKMVADHLVVRLRDVQDLAVFEQKIAREGMSLRKQMYAGGLYLVSFPIENIDTYQSMQRRLMALPEVKSVTPDIYGRGF